jgi:hypothetical protein
MNIKYTKEPPSKLYYNKIGDFWFKIFDKIDNIVLAKLLSQSLWTREGFIRGVASLCSLWVKHGLDYNKNNLNNLLYTCDTVSYYNEDERYGCHIIIYAERTFEI